MHNVAISRCTESHFGGNAWCQRTSSIYIRPLHILKLLAAKFQRFLCLACRRLSHEQLLACEFQLILRRVKGFLGKPNLPQTQPKCANRNN